MYKPVTGSPTKQIQERHKPTYEVLIEAADVSTQATAHPSSGLVCSQRYHGTYQGISGGLEPTFLQRQGAPEAWELEWISFAVAPAGVVIDFGSIPTVAEPKARALLSRIPWPTLQPLFAAIRSWIRVSPVRAARVFTFSDPEVEDWQEVVVELLVDADTPIALRLWDELAGAVDHATESLSDDQRRLLNSRVSVSLAWGDEPSNWHS